MENPLLPWSRICHKGTPEPGTTKDAVQSRNVSIKVPHTMLLAFGLDLGQQPQRGSQPRDRPIWLISPGPVHHVLRCLPPLSSASGHPTHTSPHSLPSPSLPALKELVGPTEWLQPEQHLHTTCCASMTCPFTSAPAWGRDQGEE